jgi:hypothetical protein
MDDRRVSAVAQARRKKNAKPVTMATVGTMLVSLLMGLLFLFSFSFGANLVTQLTFFYTLLFFMLSMTLIADFTSVLIDVRDNMIILPKPVNDSTFVVARLLHIFIHICKIVLPMSIPGIVYMVMNTGVLAAIVFFFIILLVTAFVIFFINAVYISILKITTPKKFQNIISYLQIVFAVIMYGSYQVFPRMIDRLHMNELDLATKKWTSFYPMYWFANTWNVLINGGNTSQVIFAILGLLTPIVSVWVVVKYLAPSFNNKLAMISGSGEEGEKPVVKKNEKGVSFSDRLSNWLTSSSPERMGFRFVWKMTSRSRDFKLKVYPTLGYMLVYAIIMFMNSRDLSIEEFREDATKGKILIISALYILSLLLVTAIGQVIYSDKYKASWIYYTAPLARPGEVIAGGAKAVILKFYIPIVVVVTIVGIFISGISILPNIILGLLNEVLIACILMYVSNKMFPFSLHQANSKKAGSIFKSLLVVIISSIIALGHYLIYSIWPALIICIILSGIASWFMMDSIKRIEWQKIRSSYTEE